MSKNKGYTYLNIVVSTLVILSFMYVGIIYYRNLKEKREIEEAKQKIVNIFTDFSADRSVLLSLQPWL